MYNRSEEDDDEEEEGKKFSRAFSSLVLTEEMQNNGNDYFIGNKIWI